MIGTYLCFCIMVAIKVLPKDTLSLQAYEKTTQVVQGYCTERNYNYIYIIIIQRNIIIYIYTLSLHN